jgi:Mg-chelatase subunit ChlD
MTTSMDIAVCLDCSLSMTFYLNQIRLRILSILSKALACHQSDVRMALIEFQSHTDSWVTNIHPFTSSMDRFQDWIDVVQTTGGNSDDSKAIGKKNKRKNDDS